MIPAAIFSHPACRHLPGGQTIAPYPHLRPPVIPLVTETREDTSLTLARRPHKRVRLTNSFCGRMSIHKHTHTTPSITGLPRPSSLFLCPGAARRRGQRGSRGRTARRCNYLRPCVLRKSGGAKSWAGIRKSGRSLAARSSTCDVVLLAALRGPCRKCR